MDVRIRNIQYRIPIVRKNTRTSNIILTYTKDVSFESADCAYKIISIQKSRNMRNFPAQPPPLRPYDAYTTWPGGVDPTAPLFGTDNQKGGKSRRRRRITRRSKRRNTTRRNK